MPNINPNNILLPKRKSSFSKEEALYMIKPEKGWVKNSKYNFNLIKEYIEGSSTYHSPYCRILSEDDCIYLGHSLQELEASFPKLREFLMSKSRARLNEKNINTITGYPTFSDFSITINQPIEKKQSILQQQAQNYFSTEHKTATSKQQKSIDTTSANNILLDLVEHNNTIIIGEIHHHKSSKKILIDNMALLRKKGVEAIYLEHLFYDTQKEQLDAYFESDTLSMPTMLKDYLKWLDTGFWQSSSYSFTELVVQAKKNGIRIIPIDTVASYSTTSHLTAPLEIKDPGGRNLMMNYVAADIYKKELPKPKKAIFFVGSSHINSMYSGVPGIAEITGGVTIVVEDSHKKTSQCTKENHPVMPDVLIYMDPLPPDFIQQPENVTQTTTHQILTYVEMITLHIKNFEVIINALPEQTVREKKIKLAGKNLIQELNDLKCDVSDIRKFKIKCEQIIDKGLKGDLSKEPSLINAFVRCIKKIVNEVRSFFSQKQNNFFEIKNIPVINELIKLKNELIVQDEHLLKIRNRNFNYM